MSKSTASKSQRSNQNEEQYRGSSQPVRSGNANQMRDEEGRFMSDDDDDYRSSRRR